MFAGLIYLQIALLIIIAFLIKGIIKHYKGLQHNCNAWDALCEGGTLNFPGRCLFFKDTKDILMYYLFIEQIYGKTRIHKDEKKAKVGSLYIYALGLYMRLENGETLSDVERSDAESYKYDAVDVLRKRIRLELMVLLVNSLLTIFAFVLFVLTII